MQYYINGNEVARDTLKRQLFNEMKEAESRPTFQGRVFYNLDYIEHVAKRFMAESGESHFNFMNYTIKKD